MIDFFITNSTIVIYFLIMFPLDERNNHYYNIIMLKNISFMNNANGKLSK